MSIVCCCANPDCMVNGCARVRQLQFKPLQEVHMPPMQWPIYTAPPLTAEEIRRIVREEIDRVHGDKQPGSAS